MDFLQGLNPQQREAVAHTEGPLLILAGAGSGKTRVITHRIAHLISRHHVPPSAILAVTFTNKAADEMRTRVAALLENENLSSAPNVSTFHSFCVRMLRRDGDPLAQIRPGFTRRFSIYDDEDQLALIKAAFRHLGLDEKFMQYRAVLSRLSHAKNLKKTPQDLYKEATEPNLTKIAVIFEEYEKALRQANALDFDDLLLETVRLLYHDEATRQSFNRRLSYLMIDEYQDTNRSQYELMRLLTQAHKNVCVVGDEDQSIYSWRGADIRNILDFERDYPSARTIRLEQNYRSTKNILEAASALVANNKERKGKWLWTDAGAGEPLGFYQRAEVKDIVAYLKLALSLQDSISLLRVINTPARGIGKTTVEQIEHYALQNNLDLWTAIGRMLDEHQFPTRAHAALQAFRGIIQDLGEALAALPLHDGLQFIEERTGYRKMLELENTPEAQGRLENLDELASAAAEAAERGETAADFLDR